MMALLWVVALWIMGMATIGILRHWFGGGKRKNKEED